MSSPLSAKESIPITVFTGFLGAGKTSVILSLLPQLPKAYKVVLLKNEFGDVEVDSKLAQESSLAGVAEIMNGCMCCVLVGQMQNALLEIRDNYRPDRIIIECSGSAFPATLAFQIRQLEVDTQGDFFLDSIITVVDAENFMGYEDDSPTARMQASYSDLILINKWNLVSERALDIVMDHLYTLNDQTPKVRCTPLPPPPAAADVSGDTPSSAPHHTGITPSLIFGMHTALFRLEDSHLHSTETAQHDDVETATIDRRGLVHAEAPIGHVHSDVCGSECQQKSIHLETQHDGNDPSTELRLTGVQLMQALSQLPTDGSIYRIKGFVTLVEDAKTASLESGPFILNWAFNRYQLTPYTAAEETSRTGSLRLSVMGARGEVRRAARRLAEALGCTSSQRPFGNRVW